MGLINPELVEAPITGLGALMVIFPGAD